MVIGQALLHVDALHFNTQNLADARHSYDLVPLDETVLHLDGWHMGVGGDDGWGASVHPEFLLYPGRYQFAFRLHPLAPGDDPTTLVEKCSKISSRQDCFGDFIGRDFKW